MGRLSPKTLKKPATGCFEGTFWVGCRYANSARHCPGIPSYIAFSVCHRGPAKDMYGYMYVLSLPCNCCGELYVVGEAMASRFAFAVAIGGLIVRSFGIEKLGCERPWIWL